MALGLTRRAVTALALYLGFYATGAALIVGLLSLPWMQVRYTGGPDFSGLLALCGAGYVGWALWPRREKWVDPGPELTRAGQPRLWAVLDRVARDAGYPIPKRVYLVSDVQAFATSRPRWLGFRRESVIGLGLPLFSALSERELRAVVAHEMGHHVAGDVRLGPWQYRTSRAIVAALNRLDGSNVFLHLPFQAYGRLYVRLTSTASREQEVLADELAARLAGGRFLGSALVLVEQHSLLWGAFFHNVVVPTLNEGFRGPLLEGYERYARAIDADLLRKEFKTSIERAADPEDTHPRLPERLRPLSTPCEPREIAISCAPPLLGQIEACESQLIASALIKPESISEIQRLDWDHWGETILPRLWGRVVEPRLEAFETIPLMSIPEALADEGLWDRLRQGLNIFSPEARRQQARTWLGYWFAWSVHRAGYRVISGPGVEPLLERGESRIAPFKAMADLGSGACSTEQWERLCAEIG